MSRTLSPSSGRPYGLALRVPDASHAPPSTAQVPLLSFLALANRRGVRSGSGVLHGGPLEAIHSFIRVRRWPDSVHRFVGRLTPDVLVFVVLSLPPARRSRSGSSPVSTSPRCFRRLPRLSRGELAKDRPHPEQLTSFYLVDVRGPA